MGIQPTYPGVYIQEFAPGAPIQGVGTSTAAFIGTASSGPIGEPTFIQSWDAFVATFGGIITGNPPSHLGPAVFGFFQNGGTACYIVRVGTGVQSSADLTSRPPGAGPALVAEALVEGPQGDNISVQVVDSSRLAQFLSDAGSADTDVAAHRAATNVTGMPGTDRDRLTVGDNAGFAQGDRVLVEDAPDSEIGIVDSTQGTDTIVLVAPLPGAADFTGGTVRTADWSPGQRTLRVTAPNAINLSQAVPAGSTVSVTLGGTSEIRTVETSGGDVLTLTEGLANTYSVANPADLPRVASLEFNLVISDSGSGLTETFERMSMNPQHPAYWNTTVASTLVSIQDPPAPPAPAPDDPRPGAAVYNLGGGQADNRATAMTNLVADPNASLSLLESRDDVSIVAIPGVTDAGVQGAIRDHCERMQDRFGILDSIQGAAPSNGILTQFATVRSTRGYVALYYPWITVRNTVSGQNEDIPPSGHLAGVFARMDQQVGVHKAPANTIIRGGSRRGAPSQRPGAGPAER